MVVMMLVVLGVTNRRILSDVFDVAGSLGDLFLERVAVDACGGRGLAVLARAAGEHEKVTCGVFFGVEHVRAVNMLVREGSTSHRDFSPFATEAEADLLGVTLRLLAGGIGLHVLGHGGKICGSWAVVAVTGMGRADV